MNGSPAVLPLDAPGVPVDDMLGPWQSGDSRPKKDGPYLRQFDEGDAISWFEDGTWRMGDDFFSHISDVQNVPWRGVDPSLAQLSQAPGGDGDA